MIKIVIADDHSLVREGLKKILRQESDISVEAEAKNSEEVIKIISKEKADILILDVTMPGRSGLDLIKYVKAIEPKLKILILSMHPEDRFALRALKSGAAGYMTKDSAPDEIVPALRKIYSGKKYVSSALAEKLAEAIEHPSDKLPHENLSEREFEVFIKIASGMKVTQIASELNISVPTVNTYRSRILEKMKMKSNVELARYAIENSLSD